MTIYNQYWFSSTFVPAEHTVSGRENHHHQLGERLPGDRRPQVLVCAECEPYLLREGWVASPGLVPLTEDQIEERDRFNREGEQAVHEASRMLAAAASQLVQRGPGTPSE